MRRVRALMPPKMNEVIDNTTMCGKIVITLNRSNATIDANQSNVWLVSAVDF